jgi:acyl-CoA reductase-like NAD-dependent aldehyde dehydrogenase
MADQLQMFIDGAWVDARSGDRFDTTDPATGAVLASVPRAGSDDVGLAVAAARRTFDDGTWGSAIAERDRAAILFRMAELVRDQQRELAELEVRDCGKPIGDALGDIAEVAFMFEYYAGWATKISGDIPPVGPDAMSLIVKEPVGVCGLIVPWNYPMLMAAQKVAPALATGLHRRAQARRADPAHRVAHGEIAEQAGVPAGVFNVVTGFGAEAGANRCSPTRRSTRSASPARRPSGDDPAHLRRPAQARHARAGRQEPEHRLRRRRTRPCHRRHVARHLRQPG